MVDWSSLNTVFLDMDGTLLDLHFDNHFWLEHLPARYAEHYDLHPQEAKDRLIPMIMAERGSLNWYCTDCCSVPALIPEWMPLFPAISWASPRKTRRSGTTSSA